MIAATTPPQGIVYNVYVWTRGIELDKRGGAAVDPVAVCGAHRNATAEERRAVWF
jgi:hypothetical protein